MSEDISDIINKITASLNKDTSAEASSDSDDISEKIKKIMSNLNISQKNEDISSENNSGFDINTILKLKSSFEKINSKEDSRSNLLCALKPYLRSEKKEKLEQYMKFMNVTKIMNIYNSTENGDNS